MHSDPSGGQTGFRYLPDPLGRLNQGCYLRQRDLPDPFGRLTAEPKPEPEISNFRNPFRIRDSVGMEGMNSRRDVAKVESLLGRAGALDLAETDGVTGFFGARADEAVRKFQKDHGLRVDGLINPNGPTLRTLIAGAGQRGNNADLPGRTPGIVAKQENPLPPFSEQPTPDPRRETIKRIAGRLLEIQKAGTGTEIAQGRFFRRNQCRRQPRKRRHLGIRSRLRRPKLPRFRARRSRRKSRGNSSSFAR